MTATPYPRLTAKKPHGGFRLLLVQQLCLVWWAYRSRLIQLMGSVLKVEMSILDKQSKGIAIDE